MAMAGTTQREEAMEAISDGECLENITAASIVAPFFEFISATNKSRCKVTGCKASIAGTHTATLRRHLERYHPAAKAVIVQKTRLMSLAKRRKEDLANETLVDSCTPAKRRCRGLFVEMDPQTIMDACVEMVTVNGLPLSVVEQSGFRRIIDPLLRAAGGQFTINRHNVRDHVVAEAKSIRGRIAEELKGKLVSLKMDTATRLNRSVLGINAQYIKNGRLELRNLAVREIVGRHTSEHLKNETVAVLKEYGLDPFQIHSITTDNAANMLKTVGLLADEAQMSLAESSQEDEGDDEDEDTLLEDSEASTLSSNYDVSLDAPPEESLNINFLEDYVGANVIFTQRCAAHTLQLAVQDAIAGTEGVPHLLEEARRVCRRLRTPTVSAVLSQLKESKPPLDCPTRWNSTFHMLESLLRLRAQNQKVVSSCEGNLTDEQWRTLGAIRHALEPAKIASMALQREQLVVGDFVAAWLQCKLKSHSIVNPLAQAIYKTMQIREQKLMESPGIACAMYLDPRYNLLLNETASAAARRYLTNVWRRIRVVADGEAEAPARPPICTTPRIDGEAVVEGQPDDDDYVAMLIRAREQSRNEQRIVAPPRDIATLLKSVENLGKVAKERNVLEFWECQSEEHPELYELAKTVLALPVTQVSVERTFSSLRFILTRLRTRMTGDILNDTLLVRANRCLRNI